MNFKHQCPTKSFELWRSCWQLTFIHMWRPNRLTVQYSIMRLAPAQMEDLAMIAKLVSA